MNLLDIVLIGIGLAMDAFAVSICKGMAIREGYIKKALVIALYFAIFQMLMPLIGYFAGYGFANLVENISHIMAFVLLCVIRGNMIRESFSNDKTDENDDISIKTMLPLAIATSIDALVTGVTFAFLETNIFKDIAIIGTVTFLISFLGVKIGKVLGDFLNSKAEFFGGVILILIGIKIFMEGI